jgi:aminoglycoside phosphotransferase (APT) family kinase protein
VIPSVGATAALGDAAVTAVVGWLRAHGATVAEPLDAAVIAGGRSNLTYRLTDAGAARWVLRRPPLGQVLESAHDVGREHRIMSALVDSAVPVPRMVGFCPDANLIGAPFFVMEYVDGIVLADRDTAERGLDPAARWTAGISIVDLFGRLHAIDPAAVGLGDLGKGDGYLERQLRRWGNQAERLTLAPAQAELMRDMLDRLRTAPPAQSGTAIVHGDFRPGNIIVGRDGAVRALLDWELCTLGDPLADLGWLMAYWGSPDGPPLPLAVPTRAAGFPTQDDVARRCAEATGRDIVEVDYYIAFALWRLGVILAGVQSRLRQGAYGEAADDHAEVGKKMAGVLAAADATLAAR